MPTKIMLEDRNERQKNENTFPPASQAQLHSFISDSSTSSPTPKGTGEERMGSCMLSITTPL